MTTVCGFPAELSREERYQKYFSSNIFDPPCAVQAPPPRYLSPSGKRKDQSVGSLFGTWTPDEPQKRRRALTDSLKPGDEGLSPSGKINRLLTPATIEPSPNSVKRLKYFSFDEDNSSKVSPGSDPCVRRQQNLRSDLFGRSSPRVSEDGTRDLYQSLRSIHPTDSWASSLSKKTFDRVTPTAEQGKKRAAGGRAEANRLPWLNRKAFNRATPAAEPGKKRAAPAGEAPAGEAEREQAEGKGNQDWSDQPAPEENIVADSQAKKTKSEGPGPMPGRQERLREKFSQHPLGDEVSRSLSPVRPRKIDRNDTQTSDGSPRKKAAQRQPAEVTEMNVTNVPPTVTESKLKELCKGFGVHVVKVELGRDTISSNSKGCAKITLRYNPKKADLNSLHDKLVSEGGLTIAQNILFLSA